MSYTFKIDNTLQVSNKINVKKLTLKFKKMANKGLLCVLIIFVIFVVEGNCSMSADDAMAFAKMVKTTCMAKVPGVTEGMRKRCCKIFNIFFLLKYKIFLLTGFSIFFLFRTNSGNSSAHLPGRSESKMFCSLWFGNYAHHERWKNGL